MCSPSNFSCCCAICCVSYFLSVWLSFSRQVDRLMELYFKYLEAVQQADKRIEGEKHVRVSPFPFFDPPSQPLNLSPSSNSLRCLFIHKRHIKQLVRLMDSHDTLTFLCLTKALLELVFYTMFLVFWAECPNSMWLAVWPYSVEM